jgi:hypothetical protein
MPGGRKTHDFPHGKPFALVLTEIVFASVFLGWMISGAFSESWRHSVPFVGVIVAVLFIYHNLIRTYERTGQAVPIKRPKVIVKFGLPVPILAARVAFFVTVATMVLLSVGPLTDATARGGIIACVFALIAVAVLNIALEYHYVRSGRATEVDLSAQSDGRRRGQ